MNAGLLKRALREMLPGALILALLLAAAEALLAYVIPTYQRNALGAVFSQSELAQSFLKALLGTESPVAVGPELFMSFPWAHPVVLALVWAHACIALTRAPAGEVDRGAIDVLMGLPVSRVGIHLAEGAAFLLTLLLMLAVMWAANRAGVALAPPELRVAWDRAAIVILNLFALAWAVGGLSAFVSSLSDRRGRALSLLFLLLVGSFLLNFLAQMWKPAQGLGWLSLMEYYRPVFALRDGSWPTRDLAILFGAGAFLWTSGAVIFARRDLCSL